MDKTVFEETFRIVQQQFDLSGLESVLILGSGWSDIAAAFTVKAELPYAQLAAMGVPGVSGHKGRLLLVEAGCGRALIFQGRRHWYEGCGWAPIAFPVYVAVQARAKQVFLTNAAGGVNPHFVPGDLMVITDHINHMGTNPLLGPHDEIWGVRFPDQSAVYCPHLRARIHQTARAIGHSLHEGVYLAASGPMYETPAEIRLFRKMGADAVGMSTVPEAILASAAGLRVGGISCITNHAAGVSDAPLGHAEVLAATREAMPVMTEILHHVVTKTAT